MLDRVPVKAPTAKYILFTTYKSLAPILQAYAPKSSTLYLFQPIRTVVIQPDVPRTVMESDGVCFSSTVKRSF